MELAHFEYRKVLIRGVWDDAHTIYLGPRTRDGASGYYVITPLMRDEGGSTVLVNRGFVSTGHIKTDASTATAVPGPEPVEVVGLLRAQEPKGVFSAQNDPEQGLWVWEDVDAMALHAGGEQRGVQPVYVESIFGEKFRNYIELLSHLLIPLSMHTGWDLDRGRANVVRGYSPWSIASCLYLEHAATLWNSDVSQPSYRVHRPFVLNTLTVIESDLDLHRGLCSFEVVIGEGHDLVTHNILLVGCCIHMSLCFYLICVGSSHSAYLNPTTTSSGDVYAITLLRALRSEATLCITSSPPAYINKWFCGNLYL